MGGENCSKMIGIRSGKKQRIGGLEMAKRLAGTVGLVAVLVLGTSVPPAAAASDWQYTGGITCSQKTATTETMSQGGDGIQHRAQGYGGLYYANWPAYWWTTVATKKWGWNTILDSRIGTLNWGVVERAWIRCY